MEKSLHFNRIKLHTKFISHFNSLIRRTNIQTRLVSSFIILVSVPLLITSIIAYNNSSNALNKNVKDYSNEIINQTASNIEMKVQNIKVISDELYILKETQNYLSAANPSISQTLNYKHFIDNQWLSKTTYLQGSSSNYSSSTDLSIYNNSKEIIRGNDIIFDLPKNLRTKLLTSIDNLHGKLLITPYYDNLNKHFSILFSRTITSTSSGEKLGYMILQVENDNFLDSISNINLGHGSNILILNKDNYVIESQNSSQTGRITNNINLLKNIKAIEKKIEVFNISDEGKLKSIRAFPITFHNQRSLVTYAVIPNTDWYAAAIIPYSIINNTSVNLGLKILIIALLCFIIALLVSLSISNSIAVPLKNLVSAMKNTKEGILSIKINDTSNDEIGIVVNSYSNTMDKLHSLILNINELSKRVMNDTVKIAEIADKSYYFSENIAATINGVAKGAIEQANSITENVSNLNNLANKIISAKDNILGASEVVSNTKYLSQNASASVDLLKNKALITYQVSNDIVCDITDLDNSMKEIQSIVNVIVSIAEQTNLLSLNAAIEAARSGESGHGFAVVAGEIKSLANQSKKSSVKINSIINEIQSKTSKTVASVKNSNIIINEQMSFVKETESIFRQIIESMEQITGKVDSTVESFNSVFTMKDNSINLMESIASVSQETVKITENVSASTQEHMAGIEYWVSCLKNLNNTVDELNKSVSIFK